MSRENEESKCALARVCCCSGSSVTIRLAVIRKKEPLFLVKKTKCIPANSGSLERLASCAFVDNGPSLVCLVARGCLKNKWIDWRLMYIRLRDLRRVFSPTCGDNIGQEIEYVRRVQKCVVRYSPNRRES